MLLEQEMFELGKKSGGEGGSTASNSAFSNPDLDWESHCVIIRPP